MLSFINGVDKLSMWIGHAFAWCVMGMSIGMGYEVVMRYAFNAPTTWAFDLSYMMYGAMFMMAGAYTLSRDGHVRGDVFFRLWKPKTQAAVEMILYFVFFFPGVLALVFAGWKFAHQSIGYGEVSINSPAGMPIFQFKLIIPAAGALLALQGCAQVCRCIVCLKTGAWPEKIADVEEMEDLLQQQGPAGVSSDVIPGSAGANK